MTPVLRAEEVARILDVSVWTVRAMARDGRIRRVPGLGAIRIPSTEVERLLAGEYAVPNGEPDWQAPGKAPAPRGRNDRQADRPLAGEAVGGGGAVPRPVGPSAGDVVVRRVERGSR